ncbi:MAG: PEP-CTERM sorting domain-containing protein [Betaproteobacteria bacterium]
MKKTKIALAIAMALSTTLTVANAAPVTFFGEDLNGLGDPNVLLAFPNSNAAQASLLANLTGVGTENFEGLSTGTAPPIPLLFPGAGTATLNGGVGIQSGNDNSGRYPISGSNYYYAGTNDLNITFDQPVAAFGFYGVDIGDYGATLTLSLTDTNNVVSMLNVPLTVGSGGDTSGSVIYFGFYDLTRQYNSIAFTNSGGGDNFAFDDMTIGSLQQVTPTIPEPETYAMMLAGLGLLGLAARRRKQKAV